LNITFYSLAINTGEHIVGAAMSGFIIGQTPILVTIGAVIFYKERVNHFGKFGFLISFIGMALILWDTEAQHHISTDFGLVLVALMCNAAYLLGQKPLLKKFHAIELTTFYVWIGTIPLFIFLPQTLHAIETASAATTLSIVYMGIFPTTLGYFFWNYGFTHLPATKASATIYLIPFFALIFGWLLLNEIPSVIALTGGVLALLGAYVISKNCYRV
jgi:drug/metabolite transporter (DMT)-like permease